MNALAQLDNVVKHYGTVHALNHLSFAITAGEIVALLGPNGAGKTTAISLLLNLQTADAGNVTLCGRAPDDRHARQHCGVMLQNNVLPEGLRVAELIALTQSYYPRPRAINEVCAMAGITDLMTQFYSKLSGGQQRRVQFALAICAHVGIVFLDEPSVGLDIDAREALWRSIQQLAQEGCAVVLTTHYLEEAEALAHRVVVMAHGSVIAEGSVDDIRARVSQCYVRCISALHSDVIASWPDVLQVKKDGLFTVVLTTDGDAVARKWLLADTTVQQLEIKRAGLAEAFSEITKESVQ